MKFFQFILSFLLDKIFARTEKMTWEKTFFHCQAIGILYVDEIFPARTGWNVHGNQCKRKIQMP